MQSKDAGSLALIKTDLIFLLVLKASIGEGNVLLLKQLSCWSEGQYLLIIFIALDDDGVYLVTKEVLFTNPLFLGFSSKDLPRKLTLLVCRFINLCEYPLFLRLALSFALKVLVQILPVQ